MLATIAQIARSLELSGQDERVDALVVVWDMDNQSAERRAGLEQGTAQIPPEMRFVLGSPNPVRETWMLAGFDPEDPTEEQALQGLHSELGFWPHEEPHQLTAANEQAKRSAKRVRKILGLTPDREAACLRIGSPNVGPSLHGEASYAGWRRSFKGWRASLLRSSTRQRRAEVRGALRLESFDFSPGPRDRPSKHRPKHLRHRPKHLAGRLHVPGCQRRLRRGRSLRWELGRGDQPEGGLRGPVRVPSGTIGAKGRGLPNPSVALRARLGRPTPTSPRVLRSPERRRQGSSRVRRWRRDHHRLAVAPARGRRGLPGCLRSARLTSSRSVKRRTSRAGSSRARVRRRGSPSWAPPR